MEEKFQDIKIYFARQKEAKEACDKIVDVMEEKLEIYNFFSVDQLRITLRWLNMTMFSRYTKQETEAWGWTTVDDIRIKHDVEYDLWAVCMPPARKRGTMFCNVARRNGKTVMENLIPSDTVIRSSISMRTDESYTDDTITYLFEYHDETFEDKQRFRLCRKIERGRFDDAVTALLITKWKEEMVEEVKEYYKKRLNNIDLTNLTSVNGTATASDIIKEEKSMPFSNSMNEFVITVPRGYAPLSYGSGSYTVVPVIEKIEIYNERVVKVTFKDGTFTKSICAENDIFDVDTGITICLLKKMLGKNGHKVYNNMIRDAHKLMNEQENKKVEKQMAKEEARKKQKAVEMKKKAKKLKEKEEQIDIQKQAFVRAMQETGMVEGGR